ncbi:hypothetical protein [Allonocardiopsis opalescens]|uniref:Uncharacterized protein n=1 Tax=Allonocardiopsis opalescens TaxID=1144618 RepID=A0A2T0PUB1_9ACTN|nr:hypothetical protein [Allonocardiopsis opalescens]PRX92484.1 hypothetical protein CLV72_110246 [Allonocardiopsis opalescens]
MERLFDRRTEEGRANLAAFEALIYEEPTDLGPGSTEDHAAAPDPAGAADRAETSGEDGAAPGSDERPDAVDPFDLLPEAERAELVERLIADSNPRFPLAPVNAEAALRGGPPGTKPVVAGEGVKGADIEFVSDTEVRLKRENKSIGGGFNSFNRHLDHAIQEQLDGSGEIWIQVRPGTDVDRWIRRWQGVRTDGRLADYDGVAVVFRDSEGTSLGRYALSERQHRIADSET